MQCTRVIAASCCATRCSACHIHVASYVVEFPSSLVSTRLQQLAGRSLTAQPVSNGAVRRVRFHLQILMRVCARKCHLVWALVVVVGLCEQKLKAYVQTTLIQCSGLARRVNGYILSFIAGRRGSCDWQASGDCFARTSLDLLSCLDAAAIMLVIMLLCWTFERLPQL